MGRPHRYEAALEDVESDIEIVGKYIQGSLGVEGDAALTNLVEILISWKSILES